jgi:hypothetical protein
MGQSHSEREFEKYEAQVRLREATEPTSDFDKAVENIKRLEGEAKKAKPAPDRPAKKPGKKKGGKS